MDPSNKYEFGDWARLILCSLALFLNHGMRDFIITALPTIASSQVQQITTDEDEFSIEGNSNIFDQSQTMDESCSEKYYSSFRFFRNSYKCVLRSELNTDDWSNGSVGFALAASHLTCIVGLVIAFNLTPRLLSSRWLMAINLFGCGFIALFSELAANKGAYNFVALRSIQGLFQGFCYPAIYHLLQETPHSDNACRAFFGIFVWSWVGSGTGLAIGASERPFVAPYVLGSLAIVLGFIFLKIKKPSQDDPQFTRCWSEILLSKAVWSCLFIQFSSVWTLYTLVIGTSFTANYFMQNLQDYGTVGWSLLLLYLVAAVLNYLCVISAGVLMVKHFFSGLNKIRVFTGSGCLLIVLGISLCGSIGLDSLATLCGVAVIVITGICLSFVGVRWNLHELAPIDATPLLIMGCVAASMGASTASFLFPLIADIGSTSLEKSPWNTAWLITIVPVVLAALLHMFLLSVRTLPYQSITVKKVTEEDVNGAIPSVDFTSYMAYTTESVPEAKSFKSFKSTATFKTAMSRFRTRTVTFNTVNEDIEADLQSAIDLDELKSVAPDSEEDLQSVRSGATSFYSNIEDQSKSAKEFGVILRAEDLDRTSAWLSTHHSVDGSQLGRRGRRLTPIGNEKAVRNIFIRIQW